MPTAEHVAPSQPQNMIDQVTPFPVLDQVTPYPSLNGVDQLTHLYHWTGWTNNSIPPLSNSTIQQSYLITTTKQDGPTLNFVWEDQKDSAYCIFYKILIICITVLYESCKTVMRLIG